MARTASSPTPPHDRMQAPKLYRGDAKSVAEQVLRDCLMAQRVQLVQDLASEPDLAKLVLHQAKAQVIVGLEAEVHKLVVEAAQPR